MPRRDITLVLSFQDDGTATVKRVTTQVKKELGETGKSAQKMGKDFDAMRKQVGKAGKGQTKFRKMLKSTWAQMAMGMGVMMGVQGAVRLLSRAISSTIKTGMEFEETWANVTTMLSGPAYDAAEDMKDELMRMSPVLGGVTELAKGMYQVLSASIEPAKAIEFLGTAAMSAKAGVTDVFTAVDALTTIINAYGLATEDAMRISDIMFMTVKRGKLTYETLARSLGPVVAISAQLGVRFEEVAAAMATLTRQGIQVRTTAVAIRAVLVAVMQGQKGATETARKLGIEFTAQAIATKGLIPWLAELGEKTGGNAVLLQRMFKNIRGLMAVLPLAGKAMKAVAGDLKLMDEAAGSTTEALFKQMDSIKFWIDVFGNIMERFKAAIWKGMSEPLREGIKDAKDFQKRVEDVSKEVVDSGEKIGRSIGESILSLIKLRKTIVAVASTLAGLFVLGKLLKWTAAIKFAAGGATASLGAMGVAGAGLGLVLKGLGVAALAVGTFIVAWKFGRWISDITGLSKACMQAKEYIGDLGDTIENSIVYQAGLRDAIKGTDLSVHKLREKYGTYKKALDAVMASEDLAIKKSVEAAAAAKFQAIMTKELTSVIDELKLKTKEDLIPIWDRLAIVFSNTARVLKEKFTDKQLADLAKQFIALSEELGYEVSPQIRAFTELVVSSAYALRKEKEEVIDLTSTFEELDTQLKELLMSERIHVGVTEAEYKGLMRIAEGGKTAKEAIEEYTKAHRRLQESMWAVMTTNEKFAFAQEELVKEGRAAGKSVYWMPTPEEVWKRMQQITKRNKEGAADTAKTWEDVADEISRYWQTGIAEMIAGTASFGDFVSNSFNILSAGVGSVIGKMATDALKSIGAMAGPVGSIIGGVVSSAVSGLGKLFGIKSKAEKAAEKAKKAEEEMKRRVIGLQAEFRKFGKISEDLAKRILELRKEYGTLTGNLMALNDVMAETGIDMKNIESYSQEMIKNLRLINRGAIDAARGTRELGEAWTEFIGGVIDLGEEGSKYVIEFIQNVRELGQEIKEVSEYVFEWLEKGVSGMMAMVEAAGDNEDALQRMGNLALTTFNALIEQGMSWTEALALMAEPLEALRLKFEELGISGGAAFDQLMKIVKVREENEKLFEAIDANNQLLQALGNTGYLTADALADVAANAMTYYDQLTAAGLSAEEALAVMAPSLQQLAYYAEQYGFELGQATQELVDQAREAGLISEAAKSEMETQVDRIVMGLKDLLDELRGGYTRSAGEEPTMAQHGFHGEVVGPQTFHVEPGVRERVDITPVGEAGAREINVIVNPVVLPLPDMEGYLIKFLPQATEDEIITIHPNAVRKGT